MTVHHILLYLSCLQYIIVMLFQRYIALTVMYVILPKITVHHILLYLSCLQFIIFMLFSALYCSYGNICDFTQDDSYSKIRKYHVCLKAWNMWQLFFGIFPVNFDRKSWQNCLKKHFRHFLNFFYNKCIFC